jgi:TRAP transporter TAXI family solute receptor
MTRKRPKEERRIDRRSALQALAATGSLAIAGCTGGISGGSGGSGNNSSNSSGQSGGSSQYTMGSGSDGSATWSTGQALQQALRTNTNSIRITAQQTGGTRANLRGYSRGRFDLIGTSNYLYDIAKQGQGTYANNPIQSFPQQAFSYGVTHTYTLAREGTGIETYDDLAGKAVWPLWSGSSIRLPYERFLQEIGIWDQMNIRDIDPSSVAGAIESGRIDALAVYGVSFQGLTGWATQVDSRATLNLVTMNQQKRQRLEEILPTGSARIEPYGWSNQNFDHNKVTTIPMNWQIFFGSEVSESDARTMTEVAHQNGQQLGEQVTILPDLSQTDNLLQGIMPQYPIHPGTAQYLREIGAWNSEWTTNSSG